MLRKLFNGRVVFTPTDVHFGEHATQNQNKKKRRFPEEAAFLYLRMIYSENRYPLFGIMRLSS